MKTLNTKDRALAGFLIAHGMTLEHKYTDQDGHTIYTLKGNHRLPRLAALYTDGEDQVPAQRFAQILEAL